MKGGVKGERWALREGMLGRGCEVDEDYDDDDNDKCSN